MCNDWCAERTAGHLNDVWTVDLDLYLYLSLEKMSPPVEHVYLYQADL